MEQSEKTVHIKKCNLCKKQVKWIHGSKPIECPECKAIRWDKPYDEAILFNLQKRFLENNRDSKILGEMYLKMIPYAHRIANKMLGKNLRYDEDKLEQKVEDAVTYFIHYFLKRNDYYITESFGFQIMKALQQQFYNKKQKDIDTNEMSYDEPIKDGEHNTFKDKLSEDLLHDCNKYSTDIINITNKAYVLKEICKFIDKVYDSIAQTRGVDHAILSLLLLHHYMQKQKDSFFEKFYEYFGSDIRESFEIEKLVLFEFIEELTYDRERR